MFGIVFALPGSGGTRRWVDGVLEIHGGLATLFLKKFCGLWPGGGAAAMTLGHVVIGVGELELDRTRKHERVHVGQYERWGPLFLPAYGVSSALAWCCGRNAYRDNRFERQAYAIAP